MKLETPKDSKEEQHRKVVAKVNKLSDLELFMDSPGFKKYRQGTIKMHIDKYELLSRAEKPADMTMSEYGLHMAKANSILRLLKGLYETPFSQLKLLNHNIKTLGNSES